MKKVILMLLALTLVLSMMPLSALAEGEEGYIELSAGSSGSDVYELQRRLTELGYDTRGVDGSFGDGTKTAVLAFQASNGLEQTGVATPQTQALLFSDAAKTPYVPLIDVTHVARDGDYFDVSFQNNTGETVDHIDFVFYTYDTSGNLYVVDQALGLIWWMIDFDDPIAPGQTGSRRLHNVFPLDSEVKSTAVGVSGYHTTAGIVYELSEEQMFLRHSDNSVTLPTDDSAPAQMTDEDTARLPKLGIKYSLISPRLASLYPVSQAGLYINDITEGGLAEQAGLQTGDVIVAWNDEPALTVIILQKAMLRLLDGENVTVRYLRDNVEYTLVLTPDMLPEQEAEE